MWPFSGSTKPQAPPTVESDLIIPLYRHDDTYINRSMVLNLMFRFNDVLDPEKLRASLHKLIDRDGWRKLGARLRLNDKGKLEYHVPQKFDEGRPAFIYSNVTYECAIAEHPLASKIPNGSSGDTPTVFLDAKEFESLQGPKDSPTHIDHYLYTDRPQLGLHVVSFTNATLFSISWPHTLWDAMGRRAFLLAWIAVLEGREEDVPEVHGFDTDPLEDLGKDAKEKYVLADRKISLLGMVYFGLRNAFEQFWYTEEISRVMCIPASFMKSLRETALAELRAGHNPDDGTPAPFVSEGDIIMAWVARLAAEHNNFAPNQTVCMLNAMGWRWLLANDLLPSSKAYIGNATSAAFGFMSAGELLSRPLSYTAALMRQAIVEQGTRGQLDASVGRAREAYKKTGYPSLYGDGGMQLVVVSNWSKAKFFEMDFSAAVVRPGTASEESEGIGTPSGRASYIQVCGYSTGYSMRNAFQVSGKDANGDYWLAAILRKETWDKIEAALEKMREE